MLVPVPLWFAFFTEYNYGGEYFAVIATTVYLLLKVIVTNSFLHCMSHVLKITQHPECKVQSCKGCTDSQIKVLPEVLLPCQKVHLINEVIGRLVNFCDLL